MRLTGHGLVASALGASAVAIAAYVIGWASSPASVNAGDQGLNLERSAAARDGDSDRYAGRTVPALGDIMEIAARPLFSPSRRPPEQVVVREPVAVTVPPPKIDTGQYRLIGVIIEGESRLALLRSVRGDALVKASQGGRVDEWTVVSIEPGAVTLRQRDDDDVIMLNDNEPAGARNRPPAAAPPRMPPAPPAAAQGPKAPKQVAKVPGGREAQQQPPAPPRRGVARAADN